MVENQNRKEPWVDLTLDGHTEWSEIDNSYEVMVVADSDCDFIIDLDIDPESHQEYGAEVYLVIDEAECISNYLGQKGITHIKNQDWIAVDDHLVPGDIVKFEEPVFSSYHGDVKCERAVIAEVMSYRFGPIRGRSIRMRIVISWKCDPFPEDDLRKRFAKTIEDKYYPYRLAWNNEQGRRSQIQQLEIEIDDYKNNDEINAQRIKREAEIESKHIAKQAGEVRKLLWDANLHFDFLEWNDEYPTFISDNLFDWNIVTGTLDDILDDDIILFGEVIYRKLSSEKYKYHCLCANIARILNLTRKRKGGEYIEIEVLASTYHRNGVILLRKSDIIFKFDLYRHTWCCEHARMVEFSKIHKMKFASVEAYNKYVKTKDE